MNKTAIKGFSIRARRKLIEDITQKAFFLGVYSTGKHDEIEEFEGGFKVKNTTNQMLYSKELKSHRDKLISEISKKGFEQVIEEVAYTWFNRIIAIRFMEINEYLPIKVRILSSKTEGKKEPDVLTNTYDYVEDLKLDKEKIFELKEAHKDEALFKYIFVKKCNALGKLMPQVFEKIGDFAELLLPDQLLSSGSVIRDLVESIEEEDFKEEVEIIGWMYQYYISEKKEEITDGLKKKKKVNKEDIPAATQLFTPKWIVKYMVQNSLGELWIKKTGEMDLKNSMDYYISPSEVQNLSKNIEASNLSPEDITFLDPSMGSGHILVYAFDLLYEIYLHRGYAEENISKLILEKNLYGLDIDERAAQLASFALLMKGRSKSRKFFMKSTKLNISAFKDTNKLDDNAKMFIRNKVSVNNCDEFLEAIEYLYTRLGNSLEYGSILEIKDIDFDILEDALIQILNLEDIELVDYISFNFLRRTLPDLIKLAKILSNKYDVVVTNPPYIGLRKLNLTLKNYVESEYKDFKYDLFSVFIKRNFEFCKKDGYLGLMTPNVWQFISSYEKLRNFILTNTRITSLIQLEEDGFKDASVSISTFILKKSLKDKKAIFIKMDDSKFDGAQEDKIKNILDGSLPGRYEVSKEIFYGIPYNKIAFWATNDTLRTFKEGVPLEDIAKPRQGMATSDNSRFLRSWFEIDFEKISFESDGVSSNNHWVPYNKGGGYRKWFGNNETVIIWSNQGREVKDYARELYGSYTRSIKNEEFYFKSGITYSFIGKEIGPRYTEAGFVFDVAGSFIFINNERKMNYVMGLLASNLAKYYMNMLNPTINIQVGDLKKIPVIITKDSEKVDLINKMANENVELSRNNWDMYEVSWDFTKHPFMLFADESMLFSKVYDNWFNRNKHNFDCLKRNEEKLNEIYINIYGLDNELTTEVDTRDITITIADLKADMKSFISYSLGCIFGRYSLDHEGLIFAGGQFDSTKYSKFKPTADNILLISEEDYFENDIVHRFIEFIKATFSEKTLEENLKYIASVLNPKASVTARQVIRAYFVKNFYKDHLKTYKKRPIYWMIDSGKQNGIKALFYLHRYDKSTIARFRTDYLHEIQSAYENDIELTSDSMDAKDKKKVDVLKKKIIEVTEFDKIVAHIANQQIEIDLDDGVEHNYELFQGVEVPLGDGQKPVKANLLAKRK
ncbi:MAG: BREX-1 system adenine-specific DNA-methyltransferase PglX [Clostridiales bacterium]|nr:BREX-1 system adenine-specific DNA-methyltransferase PglX [Clostridiales bacterium]